MVQLRELTTLKLNVNGEYHDVTMETGWTLLYVLREILGLTGTKKACEVGECGNCTVLLDGTPVLSCLTLAVDCVDKEITTIEGLAKNGKLHIIQQAFLDNHAVACGHCTPAMVLCAYSLLNSNKNPTEEDIKKAMSGVICRCTGYVKINKAIMAAAETVGRGDK
jgi:carbon-monoxide dehydrogenase small subunit